MPDCEACGGPIRRGTCTHCGRVDAHAAPNVEAPEAARCPYDGTVLYADGFCTSGQGYPITRECPFSCDRCRQKLTWQGTCLTCEDPNGRTVGYAPGDRYDYDSADKSPHWRLVEKGPFQLCTPEENAAHAREFAQTLARLSARMTLEERPRR